MHIRVLAVGGRQPDWVQEATSEYAARLPRNWRFALKSLPAARDRNADTAKRTEGESILANLGLGERVIALDERGQSFASTAFAARLQKWQSDGRDLCFLIGGADGLSSACLARADERLSLSDLTLPHGLARVLLVEQLYRAWSLSAGHPYHRA